MNIENISLDIDPLWNDGQKPLSLCSIGSLCTYRTWKKLSYCYLSGVPLNQTDLEEIVQQLSPGAMTMIIANLQLLDGSWSEVLDILRNKSFHCCRISEPSGGEFDSMSLEDRRATLWRIDHSSSKKKNILSLVDHYLQGSIDDNHLRHREGN